MACCNLTRSGGHPGDPAWSECDIALLDSMKGVTRDVGSQGQGAGRAPVTPSGHGEGLSVTSRTMLVPTWVRILSRGASISRCLFSSFVPVSFAAMAFSFASSSAL